MAHVTQSSHCRKCMIGVRSGQNMTITSVAGIITANRSVTVVTVIPYCSFSQKYSHTRRCRPSLPCQGGRGGEISRAAGQRRVHNETKGGHYANWVTYANPANLFFRSDATRIARCRPPYKIFRRKDPFYLWLVAIHGRGFIVQRSGPKTFAKYCHQSLGLQATFDAGPGNHFCDVPVHHLRQICRR